MISAGLECGQSADCFRLRGDLDWRSGDKKSVWNFVGCNHYFLTIGAGDFATLAN